MLLPMVSRPPVSRPRVMRYGVARVISKRGLASRTQAAQWVREGRIRVNGTVVHDAQFPVRPGLDRIDIDGQESLAAQRLVLMLNKPRGLVTTRQDERGRDTVYRCFADASLPWLAPVGRLDKASEGLLLFSNDPVWAARISDPGTGPAKTYHVQVDCLPDKSLLAAIAQGVDLDGEHLGALAVRALRSGKRNAWLELVLQSGRNRQIRRLLAAFDVTVLRLVRVAVGPLSLGALPKGQWRMLSPAEVASL
jgi:23S rRNA pseudouridine2605 synthase